MGFKERATQEQWEILGTEHFTVSLGSSKINATKELLSLREKGARVILLSCSAIYVPQVLQQAERLDMITEWVWILTDEAISEVRCLAQAERYSSCIVRFFGTMLTKLFRIICIPILINSWFSAKLNFLIPTS